ncbi:MAG: hypothetical protein Q7T54_02855 [Candidatus Levybacteria bacterium]|nr:hypothetical protein [Candidatus Levybacteria bacterium]
MSIAGKTMLLIVLFLGLSGAQSQSFAREKLTSLTIVGKAPKSVSCTPLQSLLVTQNSTCTYEKLSQSDSSAKANTKNPEEQLNVYSYATEPTYYVPPAEIPQPTVTPIQIIVSSITPNPIQQAPLDMVPADSANLNNDLILDLINSHRASIGKAAFQKDEALCSLAQTRSTELSGEFANGGLHSGLYNRNLPYWITENAKWGSNEAGTVKWWLNSPIHRRAIEGDYTYSCGYCNGTKCSQLFTSYTPK